MINVFLVWNLISEAILHKVAFLFVKKIKLGYNKYRKW